MWFGGGATHADVYAVYVRGCALSVTCQVAMVNPSAISSGSSD